MTKELRNLQLTSYKNTNLNPKLRKALRSLQTNKEIVIKPADQGGNTVVMDQVQYSDMCSAILSNRNWYEQSSQTDLDRALNTKVLSACFQGIIDDDTKEFLINRTPKTPVFYALPKIHKKITPPPGRPIILGIGCSTEKAGTFIDNTLRPYEIAMPSYLRDSLQLMQILNGITIPADAWLITLDIEALYSSIPHEMGLSINKEFFSEQDLTSRPLNQFILELLRHILYNNIFLFGGKLYRQKQGVAIGARCAPS